MNPTVSMPVPATLHGFLAWVIASDYPVSSTSIAHLTKGVACCIVSLKTLACGNDTTTRSVGVILTGFANAVDSVQTRVSTPIPESACAIISTALPSSRCGACRHRKNHYKNRECFFQHDIPSHKKRLSYHTMTNRGTCVESEIRAYA